MFFIGKTRLIKKFSGSSPPEIFVGKWNYPNVYTGILSPEEHGDTSLLSSPEAWHSNKLSIPQILENRNKLIYGRTQSHIKKHHSNFLSVMQEVAMTQKSISLDFQLKKPITKQEEQASNAPLISKAAEVSSVRLQENPSVKPKIDYLVNDNDAKSSIAMLELEKVGIGTSSIIKLLSAGLLGLKHQRKLVPTRWAITATDDLLSKEKLKSIRQFSELSEIQVFSAYYLGNHYEFLLLPEKWSFEVIEISLKNLGVWQDYESFFPRKIYADSVTGAYYVNRLAVSEYLEKIKRQASCIVFREVRQEYSSPLGVGILRQTSREAFSQQPKKFNTLNKALEDIQQRLKLKIDNFTSKSILLRNHGIQKKLESFF
ncbi:hypothetical protein HYW75_01875 [Candidatus Pacearchaeota archaeon]|nr:hypothetical protein [Candidatus Pacearchaeota archaeon]